MEIRKIKKIYNKSLKKLLVDVDKNLEDPKLNLKCITYASLSDLSPDYETQEGWYAFFIVTENN